MQNFIELVNSCAVEINNETKEGENSSVSIFISKLINRIDKENINDYCKAMYVMDCIFDNLAKLVSVDNVNDEMQVIGSLGGLYKECEGFEKVLGIYYKQKNTMLVEFLLECRCFSKVTTDKLNQRYFKMVSKL